ncbi:MAG TPA: XdhC family protein [Gaiellaceae bacterium]|nr:XdhC family protein [Gaiellaceae bacterium]
MRPGDVLVEAGRLASEGTSFALATVVDVVRPASTRRGDRAIVTADGALVGWIGGACSEPIVVREALRALADGETRLLRICPPGAGAEPPPGVVVAESSCASEGVVEVLVEPQLPSPLLAIVGQGPVARTLGELARTLGWRVAVGRPEGADAIVVAAMGHGDEDALADALAAGTGYVGLVASSRRASVVLEELRSRGVDEADLARVRSPAGLDLGPSAQEEIAVAILAELIAWRHTAKPGPHMQSQEVVDPVCGMLVSLDAAKEVVEHEGVTYAFCSAHCRKRFEAEPSRYLAAETT